MPFGTKLQWIFTMTTDSTFMYRVYLGEKERESEWRHKNTNAIE